MSAEKTPAEVQLVEGQQSETNYQEGNETVAIVAPDTETNNNAGAITVDARHCGGSIVLDVEHVDFLYRDLIRMTHPGLQAWLEAYEARDLAAALQQLAEHIDGAQPRDLHRPASLAAAPETDGVGGGL